MARQSIEVARRSRGSAHRTKWRSLAVAAILSGACCATIIPQAKAQGPATASAATPEVMASYASLFGEEEKRVLATPNTKDDVAFAAKITTAATALKDAPDLQKYIYARAVTLASKDPDGTDTAVSAVKQLIEMSADSEPDKLAWNNKLIDLYNVQYRRATGAKRAEAAEFLLKVLIEEAQSLDDQGKYADGAKRWKDAQAIATTVRSPRLDEITVGLKSAQAKQQTFERLEKMRAKLTSQGGDIPFLEQVIMGYLVDLDDGKTAAALAATHPDKAWQRMVTLSQTQIDKTGEEELGELATWFQAVAGKLPQAARAGTLRKSRSYYVHYLRGHEKKDADRLKIEGQLTTLDRELDPLIQGVIADTVTIVNAHNADNNDRGATLIQITLSYRRAPVWKSEKLKMPWRANEDPAFDVVPPDDICFDSVKVDILAWEPAGAGLSEVEVMRNGVNIAKGARVSASGAFDQRFSPGCLTDGILTSTHLAQGYWLAPSKQAAWVEVSLWPLPRQ